jgi:hypothetical protein
MKHTYSTWEWTRAYLVLALLLPLYPLLWLLDGRTLPAWATRKLLRAHKWYTYTHPMDFRIPPDEAVPAYMLRWWRIPRNWALNCYFHVVRRSDDDRALHDHPWMNFSIVLDGGYYEHEIMEGGVHRRTWYGPGAMRFRWTGRKAHRLELKAVRVSDLAHELGLWPVNEADRLHTTDDGLVELPVTTIFLTGPVLRRWGFHHPTGWIDAYDWDAFCEANGVKAMRMDGGSDAVASARNQHNTKQRN